VPLLINNNTAPTLSAGDNPSSVNEGETTSSKVVANDIEGDELTVTAPDLTADEALSFTVTVSDNPSSVNEGETTSLKVVANDIDGDALTYLWTQTSGATAIISGADTDTLTVTAPDLTADEALSFTVTVSDGMDSTILSIPLLINNNTAPTLSTADKPSSVSEGETTSLKVVANDIDGDALTYLWTQTSGAIAIISGEDTDTLIVTTPDLAAPDVTTVEVLSFTVVVSDGIESTELTMSVDLVADVNTSKKKSGGSFGTSVLALLAGLLCLRRRIKTS